MPIVSSKTVYMRHLVLVFLCRRLSGMQGGKKHKIYSFMLGALSLKLMYRHIFKQYVLMLHAVWFSLFQFASTVVTYMIVLLQFDRSEHTQNACGRNVTQ